MFQELAQRHGFPVGRDNVGLTEHALRRFFKTVCLDTGVPGELVDVWLGHSEESNINAHYYRPQRTTEWMEKVPFGEPSVSEVQQLTGGPDDEHKDE
jgi:integrase